jgi:hypothetical protein
VDAAPASGTVDPDCDARTDRRAVRFDADELEGDPVAAMARILEQPKRVRVCRCRAADLEHDLLVAVMVEIGKRHSVLFVELSRPRRAGHVDERRAVPVAQKPTS